ncbi:hypothetical protein PI23P_11017 [Polaribacter irgensii 23-P]|uniref:Uncharacterized protein n=1 Tax=Polaribacter irgensii 23-P TaxID=313594 RepID=A4C156_9FLAO|nr:hypothetical protein [Polaribacter irgensii]EAR11859.1 hypothetical protein PI23P_11017 [Polaribacter irgensii 23-P]
MGSKDYWKANKIKHSVGSFGISSVTYAYLSDHTKHKNLNEVQKRLISLSTALIIGTLKETIDSLSPNNEASWGDMRANIAGVLAFQVAITIPLSIKRRSLKRRDIAYQKI